MTDGDRHVPHVVIIGASAGGIESVSKVLSTLPSDFSAPVVIAQHGSASRDSALPSILSRQCQLPVVAVAGSAELLPATVYVLPQGRDAEFRGRSVEVYADGAGPHPAVDKLFASAAQTFGEAVIAVVLSGTGSDGAAGARDVKYAGGTVIIQDPDTAAFPGMPLSLAPSTVDIVAAPARIGQLLGDLVAGVRMVAATSQDSQLRLFLDELREWSGIDFSSYKQATIERRLHRRILATEKSTTTDYIRYVRDNPEEARKLISSFLIKVTQFFRDPEMFTYLREQVMPELLARARDRDHELRLWSAGCATGEEAYSLAMIVKEVFAGEEEHDVRIKIFATDLDEDGVAYARRGIYPARALEGLSQELRDRYFIRLGNEYEVRKELRSMIVFGEHDLAKRAPFPRIDLVLCRNVLIYFTPALQRRALQLFAFSLHSGGYLVLGKSESVSPLGDYFSADNARLKVFRRVGERAIVAPISATDTRLASNEVTPRLRPHASGSVPGAIGRGALRDPLLTQGRAMPLRDERLLLDLPVGIVIIGRQYDIELLNSEARRLLGIHTSALNEDLVHQIRHFDALTLREAIDSTRHSGSVTSIVLGSTDTPEDSRRYIEVTCSQVTSASEVDKQYVMLTIVDVTELETVKGQLAGARTVLDRLSRANEDVIAANQQLTESVARLRAENDDLLVAAEEIQAATEEVETLNEELQASNEELETLNEELQATVEELNTTNDDLQNRTLELQEKAIESETRRQRLQAVLDTREDAVVVLDHAAQTLVENTAYRAFCADKPGQPVLSDMNGRTFTGADHPYARAVSGEAFEIQVQCDSKVFTLRAEQVTSTVGERLAVISLRPVST